MPSVRADHKMNVNHGGRGWGRGYWCHWEVHPCVHKVYDGQCLCSASIYNISHVTSKLLKHKNMCLKNEWGFRCTLKARQGITDLPQAEPRRAFMFSVQYLVLRNLHVTHHRLSAMTCPIPTIVLPLPLLNITITLLTNIITNRATVWTKGWNCFTNFNQSNLTSNNQNLKGQQFVTHHWK